MSAQQQQAPDIGRIVFDAMQERIDAGDETREAGTSVLALIRSRGLYADWVNFCGPQPFIDYWRTSNHRNRADVLAGRKIKSIVAMPSSGDIFDTTWPTSEGWIKLGDMRLPDLQEQATYYRKQERSFAHRATAFEQATEKLAGDKTVRECWSADELGDLFKKALKDL